MNQAASTTACDLFTVEMVRPKTLHVLFFIDCQTRKVLIVGVTDGATNSAGVPRSPGSFRGTESRDIPIKFLVDDRDNRFGAIFDEVFKGKESDPAHTLATCANAYAERFVRTVQNGCLDRASILNERHLRSVLCDHVDH